MPFLRKRAFMTFSATTFAKNMAIIKVIVDYDGLLSSCLWPRRPVTVTNAIHSSV